MNIVILAAGISRRLFPLTKEKPKTILPLFGGQSLLSFTFRNFSKRKKYIRKFIIVGGHGFEFLRQEVNKLDKTFDLKTTLLYNPEYQTMNNCYSLLLGIQKNLEDDLLIINSDVLYDDGILDTIIPTPNTALVVDNVKCVTAESMKVYVKNQRIHDISKKLDCRRSCGEYIGIAKIQKKDLPRLQSSLGAVIEDNPDFFYEDAFRRILPDTLFGIVNTDGLVWTEIDDHHDLTRAQRMYYRSLKL